MTFDATAHGITHWIGAHGGVLGICSAVTVILAASKEARATVGWVVEPARRLGGVFVLWLAREKVSERDAQHQAVMVKLNALDAVVAREMPLIKHELSESAEDRRLFRGVVVEITESRVELGGLVKAVDKLADKLDDLCEDTRDNQADIVERVTTLEAERRISRRRRADRERDAVSPTEGE